MASPSTASPRRARIPRKRNRSTSATITQHCSSSLDDSLQASSAALHSMPRHEQRTHTNDYTLSPSKQIFQHFPSWSALTNPDAFPSSDPQPPKKRRKGVAGAILSTALEAALFTSAIGYAAYNFWCGKGLEEEEATRLSPKTRFSRSTMPNQSLLSSPPPPPYEPPEQGIEQIRIARTPRKSMATRSVTSHRVYSSRPVPPSSIPSDPINFILRPTATPSINHPCHLKDESESMDRYTYIPASEPINSNELDDEECEEDDEELKAFKAQIQGLIKEGREALASRPSINSITSSSSSSSSLHPPPLNRIINKSRHTITNTHLQPIVTSTDKSSQSVAQLDENVQLLQLALEKAALPSHSNWWER